MEIIGFLLYWICSTAIVLWCLHRFPPNPKHDVGVHYFLAIMLSWLAWPLSAYDLWERRHQTTEEFRRERGDFQ